MLGLILLAHVDVFLLANTVPEVFDSGDLIAETDLAEVNFVDAREYLHEKHKEITRQPPDLLSVQLRHEYFQARYCDKSEDQDIPDDLDRLSNAVKSVSDRLCHIIDQKNK